MVLPSGSRGQLRGWRPRLWPRIRGWAPYPTAHRQGACPKAPRPLGLVITCNSQSLRLTEGGEL